MSRLAVIVPTRGRPENIRKVIKAWDFTGAWADADLVLATDADDPERDGYTRVLDEIENPGTDKHIRIYQEPTWFPMVKKLNDAADTYATFHDERYSAIAFAGDDHLPRTIGWARRYLDALAEMGTGMVYGDDGYQGAKLSTEWAVTADAVRALGRMVPAPVDHLYCDNAMMDLYGGAGAMRHLPEIRIEHMHPIAGKADSDDQYKRVNSREQYRGDRGRYESWKNGVLYEQIATIRELRAGRPDEPAPRATRETRRNITQPRHRREPTVRGSGPRKIERSGPSRYSAPPKSKFPFPAAFRNVIGATPDEIAFTLADFAKQVPADQEIVELGVYQGRTALIMAWGAMQGNGAHVTAIDLWDSPENTYDPPFTDPATREAAFANVSNLGYGDRVSLVHSFAVTEGEIYAGRPVGLLFVDDDHSAEGVRNAVTSWAPHLAAGAVIAIDDYGHPDWPGVAEGVEALVSEGVLAPVEIYHDRLAVTRLNMETPEQSTAIVDSNLLRMGSEGLTAITSEGVVPAPVEDDLSGTPIGELRRQVRALGFKPAGLTREQLIEEIRKSRL